MYCNTNIHTHTCTRMYILKSKHTHSYSQKAYPNTPTHPPTHEWKNTTNIIDIRMWHLDMSLATISRTCR